MSTLFEMLYREYCRARLVEMRKQFLIPVIGDILPPPPEGDHPSGPNDPDWMTKQSPTVG
ncbi:hypothetical protein [Bradyrhizobium sp. Ce-3]|uniref:hypothetical protein n=1 Tax=Bradyrhizobium sp. Ce-3 TaxID=2913970 RepID=UPI001FC8217B|nr:hypothetical protein [Bradyrhizobium sp. Ce-3]GKQ52630.1 hypothetical protein BRSPCE3_34850 [Bradyrhizobium sp. Ce-3]